MVPPLGTACAVDTYAVSVDSPDARGGAVAFQLDNSGSDPVLRAALLLQPTRADACPVLRDDAKVILERDGTRTELALESRGNGFIGVDCAFKCRDLVALEAACTPVAASVRGADVQALIGAGDGRIVFEDAAGSLAVTLDAQALEPRSVHLPNGSSVVVEPSSPTEYRFTTVPFVWSHPDTDRWVSEWSDNPAGSRDGRFSAFNLVPPRDADDPAFTIRGDVPAGRRTVYFGATAPQASCEVARCEGIEHLVRHHVDVIYP